MKMVREISVMLYDRIGEEIFCHKIFIWVEVILWTLSDTIDFLCDLHNADMIYTWLCLV